MPSQDEIEKAIEVLKETYPNVVLKVNTWQRLYQNHSGGLPQSDEEIKLFKKFSDAMKVITK